MVRVKRTQSHAVQKAAPKRALPGSARPWFLPIVIVVGFGLFRGVNANAYLSAFASVKAPFLFVPHLFFNVVVACSVVACSAVVIAFALCGRLKPLSMPVVLPTIFLLAANAMAFLGAVLLWPSDLALLAPGILFGASSVMLSLVWIEILACEPPKRIVIYIALGMLLNLVTSSALSNLEIHAQIVVSCVLLLVMTCCARYVRRFFGEVAQRFEGSLSAFVHSKKNARAHDDEQAASNSPHNSATSKLVEPKKQAWGGKARSSYRDAFLDFGDSLLAFCVLEAVVGLLNSFMLAGSIDFAGSGTVSVAGMLIGIFTFCVMVFVVQRIPRVSTALRVLMPVLAALLVLLPFLDERYNLFFSTVLLGSYNFVALLLTYMVAEISYKRRVSPYILMGASAGLARIFLAVGLVGGNVLGTTQGGLFGDVDQNMRFLVIVVAVVYVLSLVAVLISRDRRRKKREDVDDGAFLTQQEPNADQQRSREDTLATNVSRLAALGGLTEREAEVLGYLLRGHTKVHIAGVLFVSENTVRSHVRNIYSKLEVHTRQELIDLAEGDGAI